MTRHSSPWEPLPFILYGYAVHPLSPGSRRDTARMSTRTRVSTVSENTELQIFKDVVELEVGDEIYAFERYVPRGKEVDGIWYRGYVVTPARPAVSWPSPVEPSLAGLGNSEEPQQVTLGIFPASHIHIRDERADAEGRLAAFARAREESGSNVIDPAAWRAMDTLREEDEDVDPAIATNGTGKASFRLPPPPDQAQSSRAGLAVYPPSIRSRSSSPAPSEVQVLKPLPPRPTLKGGDETAAGITQPLVDEIAAALREWYTRMFTYLARREYELFHIVRGHIEALHLGRRQLLAQTLSAEETTKLRRDCVTRLVRGNIAQGLDVIVRHPTWGALVTVDIDGELDRRSWVSAVRMYALQISLAYLDVGPDTIVPQSSMRKMSMESLSIGPSPTPAGSSFPDLMLPKGSSLGSFGSSPVQTSPPTRLPARNLASRPAKFYHVFLDLRAFVASLCAPHETVELFFSLYNQAQTRFVTEEFCAVLDHHGVLARDPDTRVRTLFTDLVQSDVQDPIWLVCRIVRNGGLKIGANMSTGLPSDSPRRGSEASTFDLGSASFNGNGRGADGLAGHFRRPFGCAVLELTQLSEMVGERSDMSATKEYTMPIFVPTNEAVYSMMHQDVIAGKTREYEKSSRAEMLAVSVKIFRGDADTVVRENISLLQDTPLSLRLGFPDVVFPSDHRNEVYIKLWSGDFTSVTTSTARLSMAGFTRGQMGPQSNNVQVSMEVRDADGHIIKDAISLGSGEPPISQFHSMVFQRNSQPTYGELIKLRLPSQGPPQWHLFFTFRNRGHRDAKTSKGDSTDKPFAFAFLPLFPEKWQFIKDGGHTLVLYRADRGGPISPEMYLNASSRLSAGQSLDDIQIPSEMMRIAPPMRDSVTLRTSLCSTRFTQEPQLMKLLNWQQVPGHELPEILAHFTFVGEMEIVKFLRDIFDALFGVLVSNLNASGEMDQLVFNALIIVLGTVQDRRFSNFQPVLDVYIEEHFAYPVAASRMIRAMNRLLVDPSATETASQLRAALKVWHYVFKFIARSRELQKQQNITTNGGTDISESAFRRDLRTHLSEVNNMMSATTPPSIIGTQTIALQHFTSILPELAKIFSSVELVTIATTFASSVTSSNGKMLIWKLIMYLQLVKGFLFEHSHSRSLLVEAIVVWIKPHFGKFDEYTQTQAGDSEAVVDSARIRWLESTRLCVTIIAVILDKLHQCLIDPDIVANRALYRREQENVEYILSLLPRLVASYMEFKSPASQGAVERTHSAATIVAAVPVTFPESYPFSLIARSPTRSSQTRHSLDKDNDVFNPGLGEIAVVLLALVMASPKKHILDFLETNLEIEGRENFTFLVSQLFQMAISMLSNDAFPRSWLNVNVLTHTVLVKLMDPVAAILKTHFVPEQQLAEQFDASLWRGALLMLLSLLSSDQLVIEDLGPQKGRTVWRLAGDIRGEGATILLRLWDALGLPEEATSAVGAVARFGGYQTEMSNLVGHVVNLCLSHHDQLRTNAVQMLYTMVLSEWHSSENFDDIENEVVNKLDSLFMSDSKGDELSKTLFLDQLRQMFISSQVDERLGGRVAEFLSSVESFLELLLSVRALPDGEEFSDDRVIATLRLMNFIRRIGRDEMYIKYVHQLVNIHLQSQNYVEAALTLQLHANLHEWDLQTFVPPMDDLGLPQQSQFHRKETLCLLIMDYLGKGKAWEKAIEVSRDLAEQHQNVTFNYGRLAEILKHQATLYGHITSEQRYYPDYFKVTYYGDFPAAIRNKHVIYRGYEWEKFGAFCERMLNKHLGARLLKGSGDPPPDIRFGNDQYIQCASVTPEPNRDHPVFNSTDVPSQVKAYYEHNATNVFSHTRSVSRTGRDGMEEAWEEKVFFTTDDTFPSVLRRSEVIDVQILLISPIESALADVESKTQELAGLYVKFSMLSKTGQPVTTNALSMALNAAVDTPAQGGIPSYRQMLLSHDYAARYPDRASQIDKLSKAIDEHVFTIEACLRLHGQMCPPEMLPFHETLEKFFKKNFHEEIQRLVADGLSDLESIAPSSRQYLDASAQYPRSLYGDSSKISMSSGMTSRPAVTISSMNDRPPMSPPPMTPSLHSIRSLDNSSDPGSAKVTPLKLTLAHLARHGLNGVSSGVEATSIDMASITTPTGASFVNVGGSAPPGPPQVQSTGSSFKGRLSRLGSLSFGRHG